MDITWAHEQEFSQYNTNTTGGIAIVNRVVLGAMLDGFWEFRPDGSLQPNTDFGGYAKVKDGPLTITYMVNPEAVWSDGTPLDCDDLMLTWLARSGVTGRNGFSAASTAGHADQNLPQCSPGGREITVTYRKGYADRAARYGPAEIMPAHVVEQQAGLTKTFIDYAATPTSPELAKAVAFSDNGWAFAPGKLKKDLAPSSGPYVLDSWTCGTASSRRWTRSRRPTS
ncbi:MAG TPA: hypothetical protein VI248_10605 [Kineosporiaceae bacterium]